MSDTETASDSSVATRKSLSGPDHSMGELGLDSSPDLYMMASDSGKSESDSDITSTHLKDWKKPIRL